MTVIQASIASKDCQSSPAVLVSARSHDWLVHVSMLCNQVGKCIVESIMQDSAFKVCDGEKRQHCCLIISETAAVVALQSGGENCNVQCRWMFVLMYTIEATEETCLLPFTCNLLGCRIDRFLAACSASFPCCSKGSDAFMLFSHAYMQPCLCNLYAIVMIWFHAMMLRDLYSNTCDSLFTMHLLLQVVLIKLEASGRTC